MSTYEVNVSITFHAWHALRLPGGGLEDPHAHDWEVTATFRGDELDEETGVVIDFLTVESALQKITSQLGGQDLNTLDAFSDSGTSAELVAEYLAGRLDADLSDACSLYRLAVTEAPGCSAAYYPGTP